MQTNTYQSSSLFGMLIFLLGLLLSTTISRSEQTTFTTEKGKVSVTEMISELDTPWAMAMLPNGNLLVTERAGSLLVIDPATPVKKTEVMGLPEIAAFGQGGLLDIVLDPGFEKTRKIYFTFSQPEEAKKAGTALASAILKDGDTPQLEDVKILFSLDKKGNSSRHFGSRIVPDGQGKLFFTIGDRGTSNRAQDPFDGAGKVLRITTNGGIPADNPFADGKQGLPQIWSVGHRNPQGATLNPFTHVLWTVSHGARGGDEINIPEAGKNYGWPVISYGVNYNGSKIGTGIKAPGMEQPIYYWDPSIAPSGMAFYSKGDITAWEGNLFVGALKDNAIIRLEIKDNEIIQEERLFEGKFGRIRDVRNFHDGALWFLTDDSPGAIYRITPAQ